jgi:hypothetical protein
VIQDCVDEVTEEQVMNNQPELVWCLLKNN